MVYLTSDQRGREVCNLQPAQHTDCIAMQYIGHSFCALVDGKIGERSSSNDVSIANWLSGSAHTCCCHRCHLIGQSPSLRAPSRSLCQLSLVFIPSAQCLLCMNRLVRQVFRRLGVFISSRSLSLHPCSRTRLFTIMHQDAAVQVNCWLWLLCCYVEMEMINPLRKFPISVGGAFMIYV